MSEIEYSDAMAVGPGIRPADLKLPPRGWQQVVDNDVADESTVCRVGGCERTVMRPGWLTIPGRFCEPCIDACYTSTDQPHSCPVCAVLGVTDGPAALNEPGAGR